MRNFSLFFLLILLSFFPHLLFSSDAKYLDNHSCQECHEKIYEEYSSSSHSRSYFNNELHRKIADKVSEKKYKCATCHMPMADNLSDLLSGKARPDKNNKTHTDGVSCFFCHTIAYVKEAHAFNINTKARQAKGFKPTLYGLLNDAEDSDKHSSVKNPVYAKKVCTGCHSHKRNENNVTIFRAMQVKEGSQSCITCHMPEIDGGIEKMNKKTRSHHASHKFLGIHDKAFRAKGIDINISVEKQKLLITLTNKMDHPLIIQPARVKYLSIEIYSQNQLIWQNYTNEPKEDTQAYFSSSFLKDGHPIIIPAHSTDVQNNNLKARETKSLYYTTPKLSKGDKITVSLYLQLAKEECLSIIELENQEIVKPLLMKRIEKVL